MILLIKKRLNFNLTKKGSIGAKGDKVMIS